MRKIRELGVQVCATPLRLPPPPLRRRVAPVCDLPMVWLRRDATRSPATRDRAIVIIVIHQTW